MMYINIIKPYWQLMRLDRPIGTLLLLWPTLIALWLASSGQPDYKIIAIFIFGVILMRAAGCVINDFADREIDPHVARTKNRPLASGSIPAPAALILFVILLATAFILALQLKTSTMLLSIVGASLAIIYPYSKRFTKYPQFILGLAFAWSIPMVYTELQDSLSFETWVLYFSILSWIVAFDTQYAMVDKADDLKIGVKSTAISFGNYDRAIIFMLQIAALTGLLLIGSRRDLNISYYLGIAIALVIAVYQLWLIKDRQGSSCFKAFLLNNYFGAAIFAGLLFT